MLEGCTPGAIIELGLLIVSTPDKPKVKVTFDIIQTASPALPDGLSAAFIPNANFTAQLLNYIDGNIQIEDLGKNKTGVKVTFELFPGSNNEQKLLLIEKPSQILEKQLASVRFSNEPTLEDLSAFIALLKGVKLILHAPEKSIFAKHLTSCLTSWNTDISHLPVMSYADADTADGATTSDAATAIGSDSDVTSVGSEHPPPIDTQQSKANRALNVNNDKKIPSPAIEEDHIHSIPPAFILIDDDILTLERKLREFRENPIVPPAQQLQQQQQQHHPQRRHRRSKSRTSDNAMMLQGVTVAVIFFISLTNYKRVRDIIHWFNTSNAPTFYVPRVVVVPKPAGPRRFLTALHTAWYNAVVEPQFAPIATSPLSPFIALNQFQFSSSSTDPGSSNPGSVNPLLSTPGPKMTPHDMNRFSPRRVPRNILSPSGLQMESEMGNYFFDPIARPNTSATINCAAGRTSPMLSAVSNQQQASITSPVSNMPLLSNNSYSIPNLSTTTTPACSGNSSAGGSLAMTNPTPNEIKRRLRSHSNSFGTNSPSRRTLVDLSMSQVPPAAITNTIMLSPSAVTEKQPIGENGEDDNGMLCPASLLDHRNTHIDEDGIQDSTINSSTLAIENSSESLLSPLERQQAAAATTATKKDIPVTPSTETLQGIVTNKKRASIPLDTNPSIPSTVRPSEATTSPSISAPVKLKTKFNNDFKISSRKRKERSSNKQSPPITVLIVEGNLSMLSISVGFVGDLNENPLL